MQKMVVVIILMLASCMVLSVAAEFQISSPDPKKVNFLTTKSCITNEVEIVADKELIEKYQSSFDSFKNTLDTANGYSDQTIQRIVFSHDIENNELLEKEGSYSIKIFSNIIYIISKDDIGLLYGLSTLESLIIGYGKCIPLGVVVDYPDFKTRALHIALWPCTTEDFKQAIKIARLNHYNTLIWRNHYGVKLNSIKHLKINGKAQWSIEEFKEMVKFVKENGLEIVPELTLLSHQETFMHNQYPEYLYNKTTYDPRKKELYNKVVFPAIDELITLTGAKKFHIGHDEVVGWETEHYRKKFLEENETQLPAELFLDDVLTLHNYLASKNIETWMWGDMLIRQEEVYPMKYYSDLNGFNGYSQLKKNIPKDIVICDWHYEQNYFTSMKVFSELGFKVIGSTWKNDLVTEKFARYAKNYATNSSNNVAGMMAVPCYGLGGDKKEEVLRIINSSGKVFWNAK